MALVVNFYIAIDDDTPKDLPPFTHDPSMWSLEEDFNLSSGGGDARFLSALGYERGQALKDIRGVPAFLPPHCELRRDDHDETCISWLTKTEFEGRLVDRNYDVQGAGYAIRRFLAVLNLLAQLHGNDRIRIIYEFFL